MTEKELIISVEANIVGKGMKEAIFKFYGVKVVVLGMC